MLITSFTKLITEQHKLERHDNLKLRLLQVVPFSMHNSSFRTFSRLLVLVSWAFPFKHIHFSSLHLFFFHIIIYQLHLNPYSFDRLLFPIRIFVTIKVGTKMEEQRIVLSSLARMLVECKFKQAGHRLVVHKQELHTQGEYKLAAHILMEHIKASHTWAYKWAYNK